MKHGLKKYLIIWTMMVSLYNFIVFVSPDEFMGLNKYCGAFWPSYIIINIAFAGQLISSVFFFKKEKAQEKFLNLSLITESYAGLIVILIIGSLCMTIPDFPCWCGAVVCSAVLCMQIVSISKAQMAAEMIMNTEKKIRDNTVFIKEMTDIAENLLIKAADGKSAEAAKKIYEAFRYSDPVSSDILYDIEREISEKLKVFSDEISSGKDTEKVSQDILFMINERNSKCKTNKQMMQ